MENDSDDDNELWGYIFNETQTNKQIPKCEIDEFTQNCIHAFEYVNGLKTCCKCGLCFFLDAESVISYENNFYTPSSKAIYKQINYLLPLLRRINGLITGEEIPQNIINSCKMLPNGNMKTIHKFLKHKNMKMSRDYYFWRIKNNINTVIKESDIGLIIQLFKIEARENQGNIKLKDFLTEYFLDNFDKYGCFLPLVERKKKNINIPSGRKKPFLPSYFPQYVKI